MKLGPYIVLRKKKKVSAKDQLRQMMTLILSEDEYLRGRVAAASRAVAKDWIGDYEEAEVEKIKRLSQMIQDEDLSSITGRGWFSESQKIAFTPWERRLALAIVVAKGEFEEMMAQDLAVTAEDMAEILPIHHQEVQDEDSDPL